GVADEYRAEDRPHRAGRPESGRGGQRGRRREPLERLSSRRRPGHREQSADQQSRRDHEHLRCGQGLLDGALMLLVALLLAAGPRQHLGPPVPAEVRRVVTVAPALSEIVLALGAGERLAGVTRFDDDPRERARQQARKAAAGRKRTRALLVFGLDPLVVAGPGGFAGELLADAGGENAAGDNPLPFFRLSAEAAVRAAPEAIVLCGIDAPPG